MFSEERVLGLECDPLGYVWCCSSQGKLEGGSQWRGMDPRGF